MPGILGCFSKITRLLVVAVWLVGSCIGGTARAAYHAVEVVSYTAGSGVSPALKNPAAALGVPNPIVPGAFGYPNQPFNPYSPHYNGANIVQVGVGGEITLRLERFVLVSPGQRELGVWENVFLVNGANPAAVAGADAAEVLVSADGVHFVSVGVHSFSWFGNYWNDVADAGDLDNTQMADFGKPFIGNLSDFDGLDFAGVISRLDGSAGGTWLDLDASGLTQVGWVRFANVPAGTFELDSVAINSTLAGAPTIPEPSSLLLLLLVLAGVVHGRKRI